LETYVRNRLYAQILSLPVFTLLALFVDLGVSKSQDTPFGYYTLWGGVLIPFTSVMFFAFAPTILRKTRSVIRDLVGVFAGATLFGVVVSIATWNPSSHQADTADWNNSLGLVYSPMLGIIVMALFGVIAGVIEYSLQRRARIRHGAN